MIYCYRGDIVPNKNSPAKIAYNNQWTNEKFDRINIAIHKGDKDKIKAAADAAGAPSLNAYIVEAIEEKMQKTTR